jgi:hypothetical protein
MDWGPRHLADYAPDDFAEIAAATGAMLIGRRTWDVGARMEAEEPGSVDYPFSGPMFVLTDRPPEPAGPEVTYLTGDIAEAVATALDRCGRQGPGDSRCRCGRPVPTARARRRDPGVCTAGAARRRHPLLTAGAHEDRPGIDQQHAVGCRHHPPVPRPQVVPAIPSQLAFTAMQS